MSIKLEAKLKIFPWLTAIFSKCWRIICCLAAFFLVTYWILGAFLATSIFFCLTGGFFYFSQDYLIFHPNDNLQSRTFVQLPSTFDLPFQTLFIKSLDGTLIHLYFIRQPDAKVNTAPTVVFFHGNAGNMGHRLHNAAGLYKNLGCNILMVEYRGYGLSKGFPTEKGLYMDAMAAMDFLAGRTDINHSKIIIFGRSLGGAVAIDLASRPEYACRIWCLILENTFTSIPEIATAIFQNSWFLVLPLFFYKNKFVSIRKIKSVAMPTLFISGLNDALVPSYMMTALYENCGSEIKLLLQSILADRGVKVLSVVEVFPDPGTVSIRVGQNVIVNEGGHNDTWTTPGYYASISSFLKSAISYTPNPPSTSVSNV